MLKAAGCEYVIIGHSERRQYFGETDKTVNQRTVAAVKAGRFLNVDPEDALNATCEKFIARFRRVEEACAARGAEMSSLPLDELTRLWNEAKHPTE